MYKVRDKYPVCGLFSYIINVLLISSQLKGPFRHKKKNKQNKNVRRPMSFLPARESVYQKHTSVRDVLSGIITLAFLQIFKVANLPS